MAETDKEKLEKEEEWEEMGAGGGGDGFWRGLLYTPLIETGK